MSLNLRFATPADFATLADLQTKSWQNTYQGMLPDRYLTGDLARDLLKNWTEKTDSPGDFQLLAFNEETPVGFIAILNRTPAYVDNLHVSSAAQGLGVGKTLMQAAAEHLHTLGQSSLYLTVLTQNQGAIAFYDRMGGQASAPEHEMLYGNPVTSIRYDWPSLSPLL